MDSQPSKNRRVETPESIDTPMVSDALDRVLHIEQWLP